MNTGGKIVITLSIASSALFAAWLLTGTRKARTQQFVTRKAITLRTSRDAIRSRKVVASEEPEFYYI